jgi:SPP1 gp7 family putative phage head morphogenesis protein
LSPIYDDLVNNIYQGKVKDGDIDKATAADTAHKLTTALMDGYGRSLPEIDYTTPDYEMLSHLQRNVYHFSAAKNYQQIKSLTEALIAPPREGQAHGEVRSWNEYKQAAKDILKDYNVKWLETEYHAAIAGGQMAAKWVGFEAGAETMPFLKYETAGDSRVRDEHRRLEGVVKAIDDAFWKTYYPPNGWNCRCNVVQLPYHATPTPDSRIQKPDIPKEWRVNLAQKHLVFPPDSAYYIDMPKDIRKAEIALQRADVKAFSKEHLVGKSFPSPVGDVRITGTGMKETINQNHDYEFQKNAALYRIPQLLNTGKLVHSAPDINGKPFTYHYLEVRIAGKKSYMNIREDGRGDKILYTITDKIRK